MRFKSLLLALAALLAFGAVPMQPAAADGMKDGRKASMVRKGAHHYHKYEFEPDPYIYRYEPRGYYPYYNSSYWSPARVVRERNHMRYYHEIDIRPPYFTAWGHPRKDYHHRQWHDEHHGRIRRHHW